jgi:hypothetical protein
VAPVRARVADEHVVAIVRHVGPVPTNSVVASFYIRIKNPGPADVFILAVRAYPSKVYSIVKDHSTEPIVGAASFNVDVNVVLWQGEVHDLPIIEVSKPDQRNVADQSVRFVIYWRKTSSSYLRQMPVMIMTSTRDIERIAEAATADFNDE